MLAVVVNHWYDFIIPFVFAIAIFAAVLAANGIDGSA